MAPRFGQEFQRPAHYAASGGPPCNISSANNIPLARPQDPLASTRHEGSRARETQRKRERRERRSELKIGRSPSPTAPLRCRSRLAGYVAYGHDGEEHGSSTFDGTHDPPPRLQQSRSLRERATRNGVFDGDGGPLQSQSQPNCHHDQAVVTDAATTDNTDMKVDDFADLFGSEPPPPRPPRESTSTKPTQYGSSHHLPFNLHPQARRSLQPATRREPAHKVNPLTLHEPGINGLLRGSVAEPPSSFLANKRETSKHPTNTYKGNDPIKRRVQNNLLRCILSDKPLPKPRKKADRMVLKCAGRQEFR